MVQSTGNAAGGSSQSKRPYPPPPPPLPPPPKRNSFRVLIANKQGIKDQNTKWNGQSLLAESQFPANYAATTKPHPGILFRPSKLFTPIAEEEELISSIDISERKKEWMKLKEDLKRFHPKVPALPSEQVKLKESNIAAFLHAGLGSLGKPDEVDKVKKDCKYLISISQHGLINQQRLEAIQNLYFDLDKWQAEYSKSSEILNRYGHLKLLQDSQQAEADAKLNVIPDIQESEAEILHELAVAEARLLDLEKQVVEYKNFIADRKSRLASTQSQILKLCLDVQAMQMNAIKTAADQESLADEVKKAKRDRSHLEERWQNISSVLGLKE